jgi:hypothetical protein
MKKMTQIGILAMVGILCPWNAAARETDPRGLLRPRDIASVRIHLNPGGAELGFELEVGGDDPGLAALIAVIQEAEPGGGHKCPNQGAIRFRLADGRVIGVGLLPSHTAGRYALRLYDGDRYVTAVHLDRGRLLAALAELGVPVEDPAFRR